MTVKLVLNDEEELTFQMDPDPMVKTVVPLGGLDAYAATKAAVVGLTKSLAPTCGPLGIRVNAICPGYVETALTEMLHADEEVAGAFAAQHAPVDRQRGKSQRTAMVGERIEEGIRRRIGEHGKWLHRGLFERGPVEGVFLSFRGLGRADGHRGRPDDDALRVQSGLSAG